MHNQWLTKWAGEIGVGKKEKLHFKNTGHIDLILHVVNAFMSNTRKKLLPDEDNANDIDRDTSILRVFLAFYAKGANDTHAMFNETVTHGWLFVHDLVA